MSNIALIAMIGLAAASFIAARLLIRDRSAESPWSDTSSDPGGDSGSGD